MKKKVRIFFSPIDINIELNDNIEEDEIERELCNIVYDERQDEFKEMAEIDFFETY